MDAFAASFAPRAAAMRMLRELVAEVVADGVLELPVQALDEVDASGRIRVYPSPDEATIVPPGPRLLQFMKLADIMYNGLERGRTATMRDVYYLFKGTPLAFDSYEACVRAVQQLTWRLQVPRVSLGIVAHSKGLVLGPVVVTTRALSGGGDLEESAWAASIPVRHEALMPGRVSVAAGPGQAPPAFVLVVEKAAIFHQLEQAGLHRRFHGVILTGRGMPCLATRAFLARLAAQFPASPVLALVDWNPFGLAIALCYAHGSLHEVESYLWAVPRLKLLGLARADVERIPPEALRAAAQPLSAADLARSQGLLELHASSSVAHVPSELAFSRRMGLKLELEALQTLHGRYEAGMLADVWLPRKLREALPPASLPPRGALEARARC